MPAATATSLAAACSARSICAASCGADGLLDQIARLGRLNAQERILHLLLELNERLTLAGLAEHGSFDMPLTQEQLGDALGLTSVHVNRMLMQARRETGLVLCGKRVTISDPRGLARRIGRVPVRISASQP